MQIRDRVKELRRVKASDLRPSPKNWRTHPKAQADALKGVLAEVGYADALLAREVDGGLMLIDGHLRAETTPDSLVPVLVLDVDEAEADKLLLTLDPLAAMATADAAKLDELLKGVSTDSEGLQALLDGLKDGHAAALAPTDPANDPNAEWQGMPEFEHEDKEPYRTISVHLEDEEAVRDFSRRIGQPITDQTKYLWHPRRATPPAERYADEP